MSFLSRQQRYEFLCAVKKGLLGNNPQLTQEEEQFVQDYALERLKDALSNPETMEVFKRMKDK
jgi:hypothetical protein